MNAARRDCPLVPSCLAASPTSTSRAHSSSCYCLPLLSWAVECVWYQQTTSKKKLSEQVAQRPACGLSIASSPTLSTEKPTTHRIPMVPGTRQMMKIPTLEFKALLGIFQQ